MSQKQCVLAAVYCSVLSVSCIASFDTVIATLFKSTSGVNYFEAPCLILNLTSKDPCKRTQHFWPRTPNIVGC